MLKGSKHTTNVDQLSRMIKANIPQVLPKWNTNDNLLNKYSNTLMHNFNN